MFNFCPVTVISQLHFSLTSVLYEYHRTFLCMSEYIFFGTEAVEKSPYSKLGHSADKK
jgi:hypothetical protein